MTLLPLGRARLARARISARHQMLFFQQMEMLLSAGVLIADALASLKTRFPDALTRRLLHEIHLAVSESRAGLSRALGRFPRSFPPGVIAAIETGEEGGSALLARRFGELADRIEFEQDHRRQIRRACLYPAFVLSLAAALFATLLEVVFPRLSDLLVSVGGTLPPLTRAVIGAGASFRTGLPLAAGLLLGALLATVILRRHRALGPKIDRLFLRLPLVGEIYRDAAVALVCKIYRSLYLANQPAPASLELCGRLLGNFALRQSLGAARILIMQRGTMLSVALAEGGFFPPLACLAIETGERSGQLAAALDRVSTYFHRRSRQRVEAAIAVINPLLTLAVVAIVGLVLISFFQAAYQVAYVVH